jgi:DNA-binding NtrC family response regulator
MLNVLPVLVICAEGEHRERIVETVRKLSLMPASCGSLAEARSLLVRQDFSVVFCSDTLPDGDFRELLKELRKTTAHVPVVVLSRVAEWDTYLSALGVGAFDYVALPPNSAETERILWAALSQSARLRRTAHAAA